MLQQQRQQQQGLEFNEEEGSARRLGRTGDIGLPFKFNEEEGSARRLGRTGDIGLPFKYKQFISNFIRLQIFQPE
jgi:hypothetical protein